MAISDAQKVDLLYKKYFGVAKTDTSTNKGAGNESVPSSVFVRNDKLWYQSASIPAVAANVPGIVRPYLTTERIALSADNTTTPVSNVYPTWKANLGDWVPPEFGATYSVKLYAENGGNTDPTGNTSLSDAGIGSVGEWNFDYQSGVLNFIGGTIPAVLTGSLNQTKVLYLTGYRYIGAVGAPSTTDLVANIANVVLSISNVSQSISQLTNRLNANTITADVITSNSWNRLYTANVVETAGNLYFTNARVRSAITNGTGVYYDSNTGTISIGQDVSTTANVTFNNLIITNNLTVYGGTETFQANNLVISDNMIYLNNGSINSNPDVGFAFNYNDGIYHHAGFFRDHSDGVFKVFDNYTPEPDANIFINTSHASFRIANLAATTFFGNVSGTVGSLSNHTTTDLAEGTNLYFTNARVTSAVTPLLTTANVVELNNLYFTNTRVASNVIALMKSFQGSGLTIDAANGQINIIASAGGGNANVANTVLSLAGHTTSEIAEGSNLYFTAARVNATVQPFLTTANVIETRANLYFTNTRVIAALYNADLVLGNISSITSTTSTFVANTITANTLTISGNATIGSGSGGTLTGLSYLYTTNVIANVLFANTIAPTRVTGNLVVDNNLFANGLVLQGTDVTNSILNSNASNVVYSISAEQSNVNYSANLKLTGTNNGNVTVQDQVSFKGTGLVRISRQDSDTIVINAGIASVVATPVPNSATEITRFSISVYRTAEFIYTSNTASYTDPSYAGLYNAGKILLLHDGSNVIFTQYAILQTGNGLELASFSATINSGNVILYATAATGVAATVKLSGITYTEI